jgi:two-component system sensor histidine kinase and response regulator WspE
VLEPPPPDRDDGQLPVVVASDRSHRFGVVIYRFLGERDLRIAPLDPRLGKVPNLNSSSVLDNGWPVLIIDVEDMVRSMEKLSATDRLTTVGGEARTGGERRKRVLVVDDSFTVRELQRKLLDQYGYEVEIAVDGMDGWNALQGGRFDLVVSDVDMPRMDGIELVQRIRHDPALGSLPVMILSYKDREEDRQRGLEAGADYYLTKGGFQSNALIEAVIDLIGEAVD